MWLNNINHILDPLPLRFLPRLEAYSQWIDFQRGHSKVSLMGLCMTGNAQPLYSVIYVISMMPMQQCFPTANFTTLGARIFRSNQFHAVCWTHSDNPSHLEVTVSLGFQTANQSDLFEPQLLAFNALHTILSIAAFTSSILLLHQFLRPSSISEMNGALRLSRRANSRRLMPFFSRKDRMVAPTAAMSNSFPVPLQRLHGFIFIGGNMPRKPMESTTKRKLFLRTVAYTMPTVPTKSSLAKILFLAGEARWDGVGAMNEL